MAAQDGSQTPGTNPSGATLHMPNPPRESEDAPDELEQYFVGPRVLDHHSKWPIFLQLHGSATPLMILPLIFVGAWSTAITCVSILIYPLGIRYLLLTVLGFVVGLSLSFRSSTAYERYSEGRKYWAQLSTTTQALCRLVWVHADEREESEKEDLLTKLSFCNLTVAFAFALKHKLRFEPFTHYEDLHTRIRHISVMAHNAELKEWTEPSPWKVAGWVLGLPMATSNPRKLIKKSEKPLGNVPLEILDHLSALIKVMIDNGSLKATIYHTQSMNLLAALNDILSGTTRVLETPLPVAYSIAIAQVTWIYIILLPFQLVNYLGWVTIPATIFSAYIILGIAAIGREIENPFGEDVNDLPLDDFCEQIRRDVDLILSRAPPRVDDFIKRDDNALLYPLHGQGYNSIHSKSVEEIRDDLRAKPEMTFTKRRVKSFMPGKQFTRSMFESRSAFATPETGHIARFTSRDSAV